MFIFQPSKQEVVLQEEGELTELVSKIVSITNVSDDEAVFALNGNNYDLQLALEELMKQQPVSYYFVFSLLIRYYMLVFL